MFLLASSSFAQENIAITTYYPSPSGAYNRLQTNTLGVGDNDNDGQLTDNDIPATRGDVWIKGKVGIGTNNPEKGKLVVKNNDSSCPYAIAGQNTFTPNATYPESIGIGGMDFENEARGALGRSWRDPSTGVIWKMGVNGYAPVEPFKYAGYFQGNVAIVGGSVGIGKVAPMVKLDVRGQIRTSGDIFVANNSTPAIRCNFEGTWSYDDEGGGNDFAITCRNGIITGWCGSACVSRGFHPNVYCCEQPAR